jgi:hypothetical protein
MKNIILPFRFGIAVSGSLIGYFLFLSLFNLHIKPAFSVFNAIIVGFGIFEAIRFYKYEQGENFTYSKGFTTGIITGGASTLIFTIFFLLYATEINKEFVAQLVDFMSGGKTIHVGLVVVVVAIMGLATTLVITLTCMQYFKNSWNLPNNSK